MMADCSFSINHELCIIFVVIVILMGVALILIPVVIFQVRFLPLKILKIDKTWLNHIYALISPILSGFLFVINWAEVRLILSLTGVKT